jgi:type II secretory pathway component PulF
MGRRPRGFGPLVTAMVRAGEQSGALPGTLREIADQREGFSRLTRQTLTMLVYPAVVVTWAFAVVTFLLTYIVPKFIALFQELGVKDFPAPTLVLMNLSHGIAWFILALVASGGAALGLYVFRRRTERGRLILDYWRLGSPLVGRVNLHLALGRVSSALGLLLARGVPMVEALRLAGAAAGNAVIAAALRRAERSVSEGRSVAEGLREAQVLPESFVWRVGVGERSGDLAGALSRMGAFYVEISQTTARALQGVIEPLIVIAMGLMVLFIVVGIFLPLVAIIGSLSS